MALERCRQLPVMSVPSTRFSLEPRREGFWENCNWAHDERLYNVNLRNVRISQIANHFGIRRYDNKRFIVVILFLKIVLDKKDFQRLYKALMNLFNQYADEFKTVVFDDILNTMGIDLTELEKLS